MPVLPILKGKDNATLRAKAKPVKQVSKELLALIKDMQETTIDADGLGLAAPQIGQSIRVCIVRLHNKLIPLINPVIKSKSKEMDIMQEGCLSLPGEWVDVPRPVEIILQYTDAKGVEQERALKNLDARIVQHEVDHLDGVLIVDYQPASKV